MKLYITQFFHNKTQIASISSPFIDKSNVFTDVSNTAPHVWNHIDDEYQQISQAVSLPNEYNLKAYSNKTFPMCSAEMDHQWCQKQWLRDSRENQLRQNLKPSLSENRHSEQTHFANVCEKGCIIWKPWCSNLSIIFAYEKWINILRILSEFQAGL